MEKEQIEQLGTDFAEGDFADVMVVGGGISGIQASLDLADSGLPLKCDMCEDDPPIDVPMCVQVCPHDALTYEEKEEEGEEEEEKREELEIGLEALAKKHGVQKVRNALARMSKKPD
jgi:ferredoxin